MISLRSIVVIVLIIFVTFVSPIPHVSAQVQGTGVNTNPGTAGTAVNTSGGALLNPLQATSLAGLLQEILAFLVQIGSIVLTMMLIYVGFLFVVARGNPEKVSQARSALLWTVVGGLLLLGASALSIVITSTAQSL